LIKADKSNANHCPPNKSSQRVCPSSWLFLLGGVLIVCTLWNYFSSDAITAVVSFLDSGLAATQKLEVLPERSTILPFVCVAASVCVALCLPRRKAWARFIVALTVLLLGLRYLVWRFFNAFDLDTDVHFMLRMLSFTVEMCVYSNSLLFILQTALPTDRSSEADKAEKAVLSGEFLPSVDIFIPTYNEDVHMLRRTVIGCQAIDYPNKTIYLLDDTRRPQVRKLAEELGCHYCDRPDNKGAKAGNMNNGLKVAKSDLVAVFDADFVPSKNFLTRTVGFFQNEHTALVQTPQVFYNPDVVQRNLGVEKQMPHEEDLFFRVVQAGRDFWNASICHGTSFVIRRKVVDEIGGFPVETITEDFFTSIKVQSRGYRLKYLNEALSAGDSAANTDNYISQRLRWAQGTFQVLFTTTNPLFTPGLNIMQRIIHCSSILYWTMGLCNCILLTLPLFFLYFDFSPMRCSVSDCIQFWLPYYGFTAIAFSWFVQSRRSFFWSDVYAPIMAVPLAATMIKSLIDPFGTGFRVTEKGSGKGELHISWRLIYPLVGLLILYIGGLIRFCFIAPLIYDVENAPMMMLWSVYNTFLLFVSIQLCVNIKQRRRTVHVPCDLRAELKIDGQKAAATVIDLSEDGALVRLDQAEKTQSLYQSSNHVSLTIPALAVHGLSINNIRVLNDQHQELGLAFNNIPIDDLRKLVRYVYCEPNRWPDKFVSEIRGAQNLLASTVRLHPFIYKRGTNSHVAASGKAAGQDSSRGKAALSALTNSA
jgi:cellulose synthase (UDP-forming)